MSARRVGLHQIVAHAQLFAAKKVHGTQPWIMRPRMSIGARRPSLFEGGSQGLRFETIGYKVFM
jgi:hypothetical protein